MVVADWKKKPLRETYNLLYPLQINIDIIYLFPRLHEQSMVKAVATLNEFNSVIADAKAANKLVVVDFTAST